MNEDNLLKLHDNLIQIKKKLQIAWLITIFFNKISHYWDAWQCFYFINREISSLIIIVAIHSDSSE
jgi:hypothetical protein